MNTSKRLTRTVFPVLIGLGLIVCVVWLFGALPVKGSGFPALIEASSSAAPPSSPFKVQAAISIPVGGGVKLDGFCSEYQSAAHFDFTDASGFTGTVYLQQDSAYLYVCMIGLKGQFPDRFARVYLDTNNGREAFAQPDDYALQVNLVTPTLSSYHGTGVAGGYVPVAMGGWDAKATSIDRDVAEYQIRLETAGGWCGNHFGLAVYHHWVNTGSGDDYGWPSQDWYDQPRTWQEVYFSQPPCRPGNVAYVYRRDTATANDVKSLLENNGLTVQLIPLSAITTTLFNNFSLIIIADDTGDLNVWGAGAGQAALVAAANRPIMGLGEGGYAFFGQLGSPLGWPHGWHGPQQQVREAASPPSTYYHAPYELAGALPGPFSLYRQPVNEVGIYLPKPLPAVLPIGLEPAAQDHAPLISELEVTGRPSGCRQLWGYSGGPRDMVSDGKRLFVNAALYGLGSQCPTPTPQPNCITLTKTAIPPSGTPVTPGLSIQYTIAYTVSHNAACSTQYAVLRDKIPADTIFVPGSAGPGVAPNFDNTLVWTFAISPGDMGSRSFKVMVDERQCTNQRRVNNVAYLSSSLGLFESNLVTHPVNCPPVGFPNPDKPPYAEDDIQIYPYPLVTGHPTQVSARVRNLSAVPRTVTVTFQFSSVDVFGIGLNFTALPVPGNPKIVTLPPSSTVQVNLNWTPTRSGHYCISVKVEGAGLAPIYTYRNLDVTEDLQPGVTDSLLIKVGNPNVTTATIQLVVDNTCPGWTAWLTPTATLNNVGPGSTDIRNVYLNVTPPVGPPLGTACHIDVQAWIGDQLIGGIRKLDVPPVQLPPAEPMWMEKEISVNPDPPTVGAPISYCIELQNPLPYPRPVTLVYQYADFGAGIGFTTIETRTITLPPGSIAKYCILWTAPASGTLHKCLNVILQQLDFQDQRSQRNIDFHRPPVLVPGTVITFTVGNPFLYTRTLKLVPTLIGLGPLWIPHILPDPPPDGLGPGAHMNFQFSLMPAANAAGNGPDVTPPDDRFGDYSGVEIGAYLDDELVGGFTIDYTPVKVYLPIVIRQ